MQLGVRLSQTQHRKLAEMAAEAGATKSDIVRRLIDVAGPKVDAPEAPTEQELLELLAERARQGNVGAIRALLDAERQRDPRRAALQALEQMPEGRRQ